jgi:hypothetical protein
LKPTLTLGYFVYDKNGAVFEYLNENLNITMKQPGNLDPLTTSIIPSDFRQSYLANYTITFTPINFQQNM